MTSEKPGSRDTKGLDKRNAVKLLSSLYGEPTLVIDPAQWVEKLTKAQESLAKAGLKVQDAKTRETIRLISDDLNKVVAQIREKLMISSFTGKYSFLSNFFACDIEHEQLRFPSVEHAFQAAKCTEDQDKQSIQKTKSPGAAKRLGRRVKLVPNWETKKLDIMEQLLRIKFSDPDLAEKLVDTYPAKIIEGNTWNDTFWGMSNGEGENHLGIILMKIRDDLRKG